MRKFHDIKQSDEEAWLKLRTGFITSSNFSTIMANEGKPFGNPALDYAVKVAIESRTKRPAETYSNSWMDRGKEMEDDARQAYQDLTFTDVTNGGFMQFGRFGSSSDGLIGDDGMIEIKCPKANTHMHTLIRGDIDPKYKFQVQGQMLVYGRSWCDFVSYCPDFPESKQLLIYRVEYDNDMATRLTSRLSQFIEVVDKYINLLK